jgi:hypothetical protein
MKIIEALSSENGIRLANSNGRWLVIDKTFTTEFVVYEHKAYAKKTTEVYRGSDEDKAVKILLNDTESK